MIPRKLTQEIERWITEGKFGHLQINFSGGKIVNVNRVESIKIVALVGDDVPNGVLNTFTVTKVSGEPKTPGEE